MVFAPDKGFVLATTPSSAARLAKQLAVPATAADHTTRLGVDYALQAAQTRTPVRWHRFATSLARAKRILKYAETRRSVLADGTAVADLYLENLLLMQNRLADAERAYLQSQVLFSLADNALLRAISQLDSLAQREPQPAAHHSLPHPGPQHFPMEQQPMEQHSAQQPTLMIP
jgi:hypothetical protein